MKTNSCKLYNQRIIFTCYKFVVDFNYQVQHFIPNLQDQPIIYTINAAKLVAFSQGITLLKVKSHEL